MDFNEITPRPIYGKLKKNIILIGGRSNIGKTNICNMLYNENVSYISLDKFNDLNLCKLEKIDELIQKKVNIENYPLEQIILNDLDKYVKCLIGYVKKQKQTVVLIDSCICENKNFKLKMIEMSDFNIWDLSKIKNAN